MQKKVKKKVDKVECEDECCYSVTAVTTVDSRGQMVLPKDVREKMGIAPGDKFAVIVHDTGGKPCCLSLIRVGDLSKMVSGPLVAVLRMGD